VGAYFGEDVTGMGEYNMSIGIMRGLCKESV
jgi:hypothetical protein